MIQARDITEYQIRKASDFVRQPFTDLFKAWSKLQDRDMITLRIGELAHLMAWYAEVQKEKMTAALTTLPAPTVPAEAYTHAQYLLDAAERISGALPAPSSEQKTFYANPLGGNDGGQEFHPEGNREDEEKGDDRIVR